MNPLDTILVCLKKPHLRNLYYFETFFCENRVINKSNIGTPMNIIHGTNTAVKIKVLWYNGIVARCFPNNK